MSVNNLNLQDHLEREKFWRMELEIFNGKVGDVKIRIAAKEHLDLEKKIEKRTYSEGLAFIGTKKSMFGFANQLCFVESMERIARADFIPSRAKYLRILLVEFERAISHLYWLGSLGDLLRAPSLAKKAFHCYENVRKISETIFGEGLLQTIIVPGGVSRDLSKRRRKWGTRKILEIEHPVQMISREIRQRRSVRSRLSENFVLDKERARILDTSGPTARGSGLRKDVRRDEPYEAYSEIPFSIVVAETGDLLGFALTKLVEVLQSLRISLQVLTYLPLGSISTKIEEPLRDGEAINRVEGPEGEIVHYGFSNGTGKPKKYSIGLGNPLSAAERIVGTPKRDIPLGVMLLAPTYASNILFILNDKVKDKKIHLDFGELIKYSERMS